jgi:hypothetical protein
MNENKKLQSAPFSIRLYKTFLTVLKKNSGGNSSGISSISARINLHPLHLKAYRSLPIVRGLLYTPHFHI